MKLRVEPGVAVPALLLYLLARDKLPAVLTAVAVHEAGHAAALWICGAAVDTMTVSWSGLRMTYPTALSYGREAVCAAAGPFAGAVLAAVGFCISGDFWHTAAQISLALTLFNLLPAEPLDGGVLLRCALGPRCAPAVQDRILTVTGCAAAFILLILPLAAPLGLVVLPFLLFGGAALLFFIAKSARKV